MTINHKSIEMKKKLENQKHMIKLLNREVKMKF